MTASSCLRVLVVGAVVAAARSVASAQAVTERGFIEPSLFFYPEAAPNDPTLGVVDFLARDEVFVRPARWVQLAGGVDLRFNSHDQVDDSWTPDFTDRTTLRPRLAIRRLSATLTHGRFTVDLGKQFIRWGKTDIVNPTDHFAPRDYVDVVDNDFLGVTGARAVTEIGGNSLDLVWVPWFTPSRMPLLDQRWTAVPPVIVPGTGAIVPLSLVDASPPLPGGSQFGVRWNHPGTAVEYSLSYFDGYNNLPNIELRAPSTLPAEANVPPEVGIARIFPSVRSYGADAAVPTRWLTLKAEAAYYTSSTPGTDEYVLYVVQVERNTSEWTLVGGYVGEAVTARRALLTFAPDRGLARAIVGRASYTIDENRSVTFESAVRQNGDGVWGQAEYSEARGDHWRITATAAVIAGHGGDFLGQYHDNSYTLLAARYSF